MQMQNVCEYMLVLTLCLVHHKCSKERYLEQYQLVRMCAVQAF